MEIAHGETTTDAAGKFKVTFSAIPDLKTDQKLDPVFDYSIHADITDSNGETRSAETTISVSDKSYILRLQVPEKTEVDSFKSLNIRTENLAGVFAATSASIQITRLTPEKRLIRNRYWQRPDVFVMTKAEFITSFPHDEYDDETEIAKWQESGTPMHKQADLADGAPVGIQELRFEPGFYKVAITTINAAGEEVIDIKYIELTDPKSQKLIRPEYLSTQSINTIEPGEKGKLVLATSADNAFLISHTNRKSADKGFSFLTLNNEIRKTDFEAT
jgi:hypothetical protein